MCSRSCSCSYRFVDVGKVSSGGNSEEAERESSRIKHACHHIGQLFEARFRIVRNGPIGRLTLSVGNLQCRRPTSMYHNTPSLDFRHHITDVVVVSRRHISCSTQEQLLETGITIPHIVEQDSATPPQKSPFWWSSCHADPPCPKPEAYQILISKGLIAGCIRIRSSSVEINDRNSLANLLALDGSAFPEGEGAHLVEL